MALEEGAFPHQSSRQKLVTIVQCADNIISFKNSEAGARDVSRTWRDLELKVAKSTAQLLAPTLNALRWMLASAAACHLDLLTSELDAGVWQGVAASTEDKMRG